jgi:hypothetical protein
MWLENWSMAGTQAFESLVAEEVVVHLVVDGWAGSSYGSEELMAALDVLEIASFF